LSVRALPDTARRIGVIGLGTGSMAVFGRPGDYMRIYEINAEVQRVATSHFTYLSSPAKVSRPGRRPPRWSASHHRISIYCTDAFSSDAIPVHLLTRRL
jgi:hypothetical protein